MRLLAQLLAAALAVAGTLAPAAAQSAFKAPIRVVVPYAAGGGTDIVARMLAPSLAKELGQPVIVENRPGASGQIATQHVKNSAPDGTTLLFTVDHGLIIVPLMTLAAGYDYTRDFVALGLVFRSNLVLSVPPNVAYKDLAQYIEAAKKDPLLRSYGVPYSGGAMEAVGDALGKHIGVSLTTVPFAGSAPALQNVAGNHLPASVTGMPEAVKMFQNGMLRIVALTGRERSPVLPDVPTFRELGVPGTENLSTVGGFLAPKGLSPAMVRDFNAALRKIEADPQTRDRLLKMSLQPVEAAPVEGPQAFEELNRFWKARLAAPR